MYIVYVYNIQFIDVTYYISNFSVFFKVLILTIVNSFIKLKANFYVFNFYVFNFYVFNFYVFKKFFFKNVKLDIIHLSIVIVLYFIVYNTYLYYEVILKNLKKKFFINYYNIYYIYKCDSGSVYQLIFDYQKQTLDSNSFLKNQLKYAVESNTIAFENKIINLKNYFLNLLLIVLFIFIKLLIKTGKIFNKF